MAAVHIFLMRTFMVCPRRDFPYKPSLFSTTEFLQRMSAFPLQYSPLAPLTKTPKLMSHMI